MHVKSEHRKALAIVITGVFLVSFLFTSLGNLIPIASGASDSWWSDSFSYRKAITIDHTKVGGILENFPILIDITDSNLAHSAQPDGDDIVFVDTGAGVKLNHEIEYYDNASGHLVAWINIPLLTNSEDMKLHMYYGNQTMENQQTPLAVWDSSNRMVLHLDEKTGTHYDSTVNGNNGTPYNGVIQGIAGKIDGSDTFDGVNDYVQVAHSNTISGFTEALTASFWLRLDDVSRRQTILNKYNTGTNQKGWYIDYVPNRLYFFASPDGSIYKSWYASFLPTAGTWYYVTVVWQASTVPKFYVNGVQVTTGSDTPTTYASIYNNVGVPLSIGRCPYDASRYLKGGLDEIRISNPARSAAYILTSYNNQRSPTTFYTLGSEESHTGAPTISNENPINGAIEVNTNPTLSILASDSELMTIIFQTNATGTWQEIQKYANAGSGTYACIPISMNKLGTVYHWSVSVTDGENWNNKTYSFTTTATILKSKWTKNAVSTHSGVVIGDIDGDGLEEVIQAGEGRVTAIDGRDGTTRWTYSDSGVGFWAQPEMADLNKDGTLEVVVPLQYARGVLVLHGNNGSLYWQIRYLGGTEVIAGLVIGDIDGNGYPRIFVAVEDVELPYEGTLTALSYDGKILNQVSVWRPCGGGLSLADADNDGEFEIYIGDRNANYGDGGLGQGCYSVWARNLTTRWARRDILCSSGRPMLADVNNDGILEVITGDQSSPTGIAVLDSRTGASIRETLNNDAPIHYQASIYDIDGDGNLEVLMADGTHNYDGPTYHDVVIFDLVQWKVDARIFVGEPCVYGPKLADVNGDGLMEIIAVSFHGIHIIDRTYSIIASMNVTLPDEELNYAVVQDIDGDGYNEIVVAGQSGRVYAYDTPARRPAQRARSEVAYYSERRLGVAEYVPPPGAVGPIISDMSPSNDATNVPISISQLSFKLTDFQKYLMNYTVTTSPYIGAPVSGTNVANGIQTVPVSGLQYATTYSWQVNATDGTTWTNKTFTFTTEDIKWGSTDWQFRTTITIDPGKVSTDQTNFPVEIDLTDSDFIGKALPNGNDFLFTDDNNTKLNHEIESYDSPTGHLIAWVNVPFVSSTTFTNIRLYYGNPSSPNQENPMAVWDTSSKMVLHLSETHECRMWGMIANSLPNDTVLDHLINLPYSLEALSSGNRDGWGIVYYAGTEPTVLRGPLPAYLDPNYDVAVNELADSGAWIGVAHVRARSSGGIPPYGNPHPFMRFKDGKWWAFSHNGNLNKDTLKSLIGAEYLAANPPTYGGSWDSSDAIDSDLYELYVLKCIEANNWNVLLGIAQAVTDITKLDSGAANFLLTDGITLWGFRKGNTLEYYYSSQYSAVASQHPTSTASGWVSLSDYNLITLTKGNPPSIISDIRTQYPLLVDSPLSNSIGSADLRNNATSQDWYESRGDDPTLLFLDTANIGGNTGKKAGFTASSSKNAYLTQEFSSPQTSTFSVQWDIYVDSILDISSPDRAGFMLLGSDLDAQKGPCSTDSERFVYLAFYKDLGGTSGSADLVAMSAFSTFTTVASGLSLDQWYTIKVVVNVPAGTYDIYLNGVLMATKSATTKLASVTHISFAQWNDGAGAFYVDNVYSPTADRYRLTTSTTGNGSIDINPADSSYTNGSKVTLTAIPNSGAMFTGWTGDTSGTSNPLTITMDSDKTVVASFTQLLLMDPEFNDGTDSADLRNNAASQDWYESRGDVPTLLTLDNTGVGNNTSKKAKFTGSPTGNAYLSQEFSSPQTGVFSVQWDIYVDEILDIASANPDRAGWMMIGDDSGGTGGPNNPGAERFVLMAFYKDGGGTSGTMDLVVRQRNAGWTAFTTVASGLYLKQWYTIKVVCDLGADTYDIYLNGAYTATVTSFATKTSVTHISFAQWNDGAGTFYVDNVFAPPVERYRLTVNVVGNGSVAVDKGESTYLAGTEVTLTATADPGSVFAGWDGDLIDYVNPITIVMDSDRVVTATFIVPQYTLTINTVGSGTVIKTPDKPSYEYGETVSLTASPTIGWSFLYWSGDLSGTDNPSAIVMDRDKTVTARFIKDGTCIDSTVNANDGSLYGGVIQGATGKIGNAYSFDGVNDYIEVPNNVGLSGFTEAFTASFWLKLQDTSRRQAILNKYDTAGNQRSWMIEFQTHPTYGKVLDLLASQNGISYSEYYARFSPTAGQWYYITVVWESGQIPKFYVNGAQLTTIGTSRLTSIFNNVNTPLHIGRCTYIGGRYLSGSLDEIRISNPARSASYILTSYNNQQNPSTFYHVGAEESLPNEPIISDPYPENGATNVPISLDQLSFNLADYQHDLMTYYVATNPNIGSNITPGVGNGEYAVPVTGLQYATTYTWQLNVTDGTHWTNRTFTFTTESQVLQLLVDSELNNSADSADLIANGSGQDWYESRNNVPTLLFLDETDIGGNNGKKAGFTASSSGNAYLSQEFSSPQTGTFTAQWDIYVDSILAVTPYRAGQMMIGSDLDGQKGPSSTDTERFVFLAFYKDGGATSGPVDLVAMSSFSNQITIASNLNLKQWYTIKVVVNVTKGSYDIYVNGDFKQTFNAATKLSSVTHISFAQWNDGAGAFYIDNVYAFIETSSNQTPIIDSYYPTSDPTISEGQTQEFNVTYHDPEIDATTVQWYSNGTPTVTIDSYIFTAGTGSTGTYGVNVTITDEHGASTSKAWTLTVLSEPSPLLVDSEFNNSTDSADLIADSSGQDWYESRAQAPTLLFLDESNVGNDTGKKAGFTASSAQNAYLTQDLKSPQTGMFSVQYDIYVDSIIDINGNPDRSGIMMLGSTSATYGPNRNDVVRFAFLGFYKDGGGTTGTADLVAMTAFGSFTTVASGLNLDQWYTIKVVVNVAAKTYDVYVDGAYKGSFAAVTVWAQTAISHISFAQWNDGAGSFYVDNVFSPPVDRYKLNVITDGVGTVAVDPGESTYANGTVVSLTPTAGSVYTFDHWELDGLPSGSTIPYLVTMNANHEVAAIFVGPTLLMPFDSNETPVAVDKSGFGNNGTVTGADWTSDYGGCYFFNSTEKDYITVPDATSLDGGGNWSEITIEFWLKPTVDNKGVRLIEKRSTGSSYQIGFQTTPSPGILGNQLYWDIWTSVGYKEIVAPFGLPTGEWSHVVCTYQDGTGLTIYVNGTVAINAAWTGTIKDSTCPISFGRYGGGNSSYFTGFMDDIRLYNKALPQTLIAQQFDGTKNTYT